MAQRSIVPFLYGNSPALRSIPDPRALIERLFGEIPDLTGNTALAAPRIDVSETDREIRVRAELPGVDQNDIEVMVDDDLLTIRGEKKIERDEKQENFHVVERATGAFMRTIRLPFPVDPSAVEASYDNGVLTVTLPKPAEAKQRSGRVEVRGAARQDTGGAESNRASQTLSDAAATMRSANASETAGAGTGTQGADTVTQGSGQEASAGSQQKATAS
jgi:HSP20 family protein